jgi:hypothetical protein
MVANGGTDEKRMDEIASAEPEDATPTPTGPNGKPLTKKEREYLAALGAAEDKRHERICGVVQKLRDLDTETTRSMGGATSFEDLASLMPELARRNTDAQPLYGELAGLAPEQAANIRVMQQVSNDVMNRFLAASNDPVALRNVAQQMKTEIVPDATYNALVSIEEFGMDTCGVSINNN